MFDHKLECKFGEQVFVGKIKESKDFQGLGMLKQHEY